MADAETPVEVDVNTDNLDDFELLFAGKAKQADAPAATTTDEEVDNDTPVDDDTDATDDEPVEDEPSDPEESGEEDDGEPKDEEAEDEEDDDIFKPKPKSKQTAKERIAELTAARRGAERELEAERTARADLERRLRALEESRKSPSEDDPNRNPQPRRKEADPNAPRFDDVFEDGSPVYPLGEFDPQYVADMTDYRFEQRMKQVDAQRAQEAEQQARQAEDAKLAQAWEGKLTKAEEELPDLRPTIKVLDAEFGSLDPNYGMYLAQTIMSMDAGPEVLYYLANNVDEARDIVAAGPQGATLKLGKLEAKIQSALAKKAAKPVRTTKAAKPPVTTRGTGSRGATRGDTDNLDAFEKEFFKRG